MIFSSVLSLMGKQLMRLLDRLLSRFSSKVQIEPASTELDVEKFEAASSNPPSPNVCLEAELMLKRFMALDKIWTDVGRDSVKLPNQTKLWHAGVIGPGNPPKTDSPLWTTNDSKLKGDYARQAYEYGVQINRKPYITEFVTVRDLKLADLKNESLGVFTHKLCANDHNKMKAAVGRWLIENKLDGIIRVNREEDEVVIGNPTENIMALGYEEIKPLSQ